MRRFPLAATPLKRGSCAPGASDPPSSQLILPLFLFLPPENDKGAMNGREYYTASLFNLSSQKFLSTTTMLCKKSIEGINKGREKLTEVVNRLENENHLCEDLQVQLIVQDLYFHAHDAKSSVKLAAWSL
jgi:hypothetical protein